MAKRKKREDLKSHRVTIRFSVKEYNRLLWLAESYAGGCVVKWLRHAALEAERRHLK